MGRERSSSSSSSTSASSFFRPLRSAARRRDYNNEPTHLLLLPSTIHLLQPTSDKQTNARDPTYRMTRDGGIRARARTVHVVYRLLLATRSSSSFFLMAYELEDPLAALASSSARHSEMDLTLWKADSRVCTQRRSGDRFNERRGGDKRYQRA